MQATTNTYPLVLFDGVCNLCNGAIQWIIRHDGAGKFRFAALQSELAQQLLTRAGLDAKALDSVVVIDEAGVHQRSAAALRIAWHLGGVWRWASYLRVIPGGLRDGLYDWIARNRYRWFGRREECMIPTPALRARFLS